MELKPYIDAIRIGHELLDVVVRHSPKEPVPSRRKYKVTVGKTGETAPTPAKGTPTVMTIIFPESPEITVVKDFDSLGAAKRYMNEKHYALRSRVKKDGTHHIEVIGNKDDYYIK